MKKKATLGKKLMLGKSIVANLSTDQRLQVAGGVFSTRPFCISMLETCPSIPVDTHACQKCP